jgi:hypothetical protein
MADSQVAQRSKKPPLSSSSRWVIARKISQYLILAAFLLIFLRTAWNGLPAYVVNIFMRLDPLLMLANLLSSRIFLLHPVSSPHHFPLFWTRLRLRSLGTIRIFFSFDRIRERLPGKLAQG